MSFLAFRSLLFRFSHQAVVAEEGVSSSIFFLLDCLMQNLAEELQTKTAREAERRQKALEADKHQLLTAAVTQK